MSILMCSDNGLPYQVDTNVLPSTDGNPCAERLIEIAAALEREGVEGVRVQSTPIGGELSVITTSLLHGSLGEYVMGFFADYALTHKKIFSVDAALVIAEEFKKQAGGACNE